MSNEVVESGHSDNKQFFIEDEKFELLKLYKEKIFSATQVSPTLRKLVNAVITRENLDKVANALIQSLNNSGG